MLPIHSFAPLVLPSSRVLVLGSMPGRASLRAGAYYAHPRNAFWSIVAAVGGAPPGAPYDARVAAMLSCGIALWDVASSCVRPGSLDADIDDASVVPNDVPSLLRAHPSIERIGLNGGKAASLFRRHIAPRLEPGRLDVRVLPSTSPAHASIRPASKEEAWRIALHLETAAARGARSEPAPRPAPLSGRPAG